MSVLINVSRTMIDKGSKKKMLNKLVDWGKHRLSSPRALITILAISLLLHLGYLLSPLRSDDYLQFYALTGSQALFENGFAIADPDLPIFKQLSNQFNFIDADSGNFQNLVDYGALPWWAEPGIKVHFFRPLSSLSSWIDFNLWPEQLELMHAENLLIFLLLVCVVYRLYKHTSEVAAIAALAALFYALDISHNESLSWIAGRNAFLAPLFGVMSIISFIQWRETQNPGKLLLSLSLLLLSLLSAEAGVGTIAYLFAYLLWMDKAPWLQRVYALLPAVAVILLWRLTYNYLGYGSHNVAHYVDPGREIIPFTKRLIEHFPVMFTSLVTALDGSSKLMPLAQKQTFWIVNSVIAITFLLIFIPVLKQDKINRFWMTGALIAIVPPCAINVTSPRVFGLVAVGFFMVLANYIHWAFSTTDAASRSRSSIVFSKTVASLMIFLHLLTTMLYLSASTVGSFVKSFQGNNIDGGYVYYQFDDFDYQNKHIMVVNSPQPFLYQIAPYRMQYEGKPIPLSIRTLAPGLTPITLTRRSATELEVSTEVEFPLLSNREIPGEKALTNAGIPHFTRALMGFWSSNEQRFSVGQRYNFVESDIEIIETHEQLPRAIKVTLKLAALADNYVFVTWDWQATQYRQLALPAVGDSITVPGPFQ